MGDTTEVRHDVFGISAVWIEDRFDLTRPRGTDAEKNPRCASYRCQLFGEGNTDQLQRPSYSLGLIQVNRIEMYKSTVHVRFRKSLSEYWQELGTKIITCLLEGTCSTRRI